ncbi:MAG: TonB-dependent receptor [Acidobacteria bacterium]|nr:TonB-dependent receptor [Acidobacteriota bacterium]
MSFSRSLPFTAAILFATVVAAQESRQPLPPVPTAPTSAPISAASAAAASMRGTITDPDQAVIPGATITLTPPKGKAIVAESGADGTYQISNIPNGTYNVTVTMPGFATVVKQNAKFSTGQVMTMNVKMAIEEQATEVNVTTTSNQVSVDQDNNASALVIKGKDLDALSDDPDELQSELSALAGPAAGPNGGQIYVDGFTGGSLPPKSSIREIRVNQNPFTAQYDKPGYGRIEVLTKPGTDVFHGMAMIMGNHSSFNTSSPFLGGANNFPSYYTVFTMGSLSGPLSKHISFNVSGSYRDIEENTIITGKIISHSPTDPTLCAPGDTTCQLYDFPVAYRANPNPRKRGEISPRLDFALGEKNTLSIRYQYEGGPSRNSGPGGLVLPTNAYNSDSSQHRIQIADSWIASPKVVNENRFEYRREESSRTSLNNAPTLNVLGTFNGGGNSNNNDSVSSRFEYQNYTSIALAKNFVRMGARLRYYRSHLTSTSGANGTYTYSGIEGVGDGTAADAYRLNRPDQFSITNVNVPTVSTTLADLGLYLEDDWKVLPNLTLTGGVRYETQNQIHSAHDIAPRVSLAWGIPRKSGSPLTVIRAGAGVFYDRFDVDDVLTTVRQNGTNQVETIYRPDGSAVCAPGQPISNCGSGSSGKATRYDFAPDLRSEYNLQFALGVDQQLAKSATLSVNFISSNGNHAYLSRAFGNSKDGYDYQFTSAGMYRQQQVIANVKWNPSAKFSLFSYYVYSHAMSNTDGADTFATDSTNRFTDYGRAGFNRTHRVVLFGNTTLPWGISMSPILVASSGMPYDITVGKDVNDDSQRNDRAAFAKGRTSANCRVFSDFLDPNEQGAYPIGNNYDRIPSNYCSTPAYFNLNLRVTKSFGFGAKRNVPGSGSGGDSSRGRSRGSSGGGSHGSHGSMMFGGGGSSNHRYNFNLGAQAFNLFNVVPYGTPQGSLANPDNFGKPLNIQSSGFGSSAVRRIMLQLSFNF